MKKSMYFCLFGLTIMVSTSFLPKAIPSIDLVGTKWMSPITDDCSYSLCFNSERNVLFSPCGDDWKYEVGYTISGEMIEINVYGSSPGTHESKLILYMDNDILRQRPNADNDFPRNYIKIPEAECE